MGRRVSRKKKPMRETVLKRFSLEKGRRFWAAALCAVLAAGSVISPVNAAYKNEDGHFAFELERAQLYEALQQAVKEGNSFDKELAFATDDDGVLEAYQDLFEADGSLYEAELPKSLNRSSDMKLRVFARLDGDWELDSNYEFEGDEQLIFLLSNRTDETQTAVITVDDKYTDPVAVAAGKTVDVSDEESDAYIDAADEREDQQQEPGQTQEVKVESVKEESSASAYDSQEGQVEKENLVSSISRHLAALVKATASNGEAPESGEAAEPSEEQQETEQAADRVVIENTASPSDASDSNADPNRIEGELLSPIRLGRSGAAAFVTTMDEAGMTEVEEYASPSDASPSNAQVYEADLGDIQVRVTAEEDALPETASLQVTPVAEEDPETSGQYSQVKAAIEESGRTYDGMLVYDIGFADEDGSQIEPNQAVQVWMKLNAGLLPPEADPNTVQVLHLAENGGELRVEPVAAADGAAEAQITEDGTPGEAAAEESDGIIGQEEAAPAMARSAYALDQETVGTVTVGQEGLEAEFEVESFSSFAITWGSNWNSSSATVQYVTENGSGGYEEFTYADAPNSITLNNNFSIDTYKPGSVTSQDGTTQYTYEKMMLASGGRTTEISGLTARRQVGNQYRLYYSSSSGNGWVADGSTIYMVYQAATIAQLETVKTADTLGKININLYDFEANSASKTGFPFGGEDWTNTNGGVKQGVVESTLTNGWPVLRRSSTSLNSSGLFTDSNKKNKDSANHLFQLDDKGYYEYDSAKNYAEFQADSDEFTVYTVPRASGTVVPANVAQFLPFNKLNPLTNTYDTYTSHKLGASGNESENYYFGMTVDMNFIMPKDGQITYNGNSNDMVFEFAGDDDVWVFIDDVLVLDMGGVHDNYNGSINFATGEVYVEAVNTGSGYEIVGGSSRPQYTTIADMFEKAGKTWDGSDYATHTLKFYYLERGAGGSNCKIKLNLPAIPQGTINFGKALTYANVKDAADFDFTFKAYVDYDGDGEDYQLYTGPYKVFTTGVTDKPVAEYQGTADGIIKLKDNQYAQLTGGTEEEGTQILATSKFYVQEIGATSDKYNVTVDGTVVSEIQGEGETVLLGVETGKLTVGDHPYITFKNAVSAENQFNLRVDKKLEGGAASQDVFQIQVLLGDKKTPYEGTYTVYDSDGNQVEEKTAANGILELKAGQYALITGLVGGNRVTVLEQGLESEGMNGRYSISPVYSMTNGSGTPLAGNAEQLKADSQDSPYGGITGVANEGTKLGSEPVIWAVVTNTKNPGLTIQKTVEGNMADAEKDFTFTLTVKDKNGELVSVEGTYGGHAIDADGTFTLKGGEKIVIPSLPYGCTYTVAEADYSTDGYKTTVNEKSGRETAGTLTADQVVSFLNTKGVTAPTGLFTNNRPYLLLMSAGIGCIGVGLMAKGWKKRRIGEEE